ncbi:MAG: type II secretion system protein M [Nitrospinota bacterium]|nr:type II secretion system protein M [Nitrospinota bacterium]
MKYKIIKTWKSWNRRERILIVAGSATVIAAMCYAGWLKPLLEERSRLEASIIELRRTAISIERSVEEILTLRKIMGEDAAGLSGNHFGGAKTTDRLKKSAAEIGVALHKTSYTDAGSISAFGAASFPKVIAWTVQSRAHLALDVQAMEIQATTEPDNVSFNISFIIK